MSELQFDRAEFAQQAPARVQCTSCNREVVQSYYERGGKIICSACREDHESGQSGLGGDRLLRAALAGLGVAIAGSGVWYGIAALTGYEFGLLSIFIGIGVGKAMMWGSRGKGGPLYQVISVALTYLSIAGSSIPILLNFMDPVAAFLTALTLPVTQGLENIIGLLIIAFGLFEAGKITRRNDAAVTGPYSVSTAAPATVSAPAPAANV